MTRCGPGASRREAARRGRRRRSAPPQRLRGGEAACRRDQSPPSGGPRRRARGRRARRARAARCRRPAPRGSRAPWRCVTPSFEVWREFRRSAAICGGVSPRRPRSAAPTQARPRPRRRARPLRKPFVRSSARIAPPTGSTSTAPRCRAGAAARDARRGRRRTGLRCPLRTSSCRRPPLGGSARIAAAGLAATATPAAASASVRILRAVIPAEEAIRARADGQSTFTGAMPSQFPACSQGRVVRCVRPSVVDRGARTWTADASASPRSAPP